MSGCTPNFCAANGAPRRPKPVITYNTMDRQREKMLKRGLTNRIIYPATDMYVCVYVLCCVYLVKDQQDAVLVANCTQALQVPLRRQQHTYTPTKHTNKHTCITQNLNQKTKNKRLLVPVEPATGSTITAAIVDASCSATSRSKSSAKCAPHSGCPRANAFFSRLCVCDR